MSLSTNISNLATRIATEVKGIRTLVNGNVADLSALDTTAKSNLVAALNEIKAGLDSAASDILDIQSVDSDLQDQVDAVVTDVGSLSGLTTTAKATLVAAINELQSEIDSIDVTSVINDSTTGASSTWSSSKIDSEIADAVSALVDGAPALLDTLNELAAAIGDDASFATTITNSIATKANDADVVKLTGAQTVAGVKTFSSSPVVPDASFAIAAVSGLQAALDSKASNADVGSTTTNYVITFESGLV